jgi:hypothetical protein
MKRLRTGSCARRALALCGVVAACAIAQAAPVRASETQIVGWIERVRLGTEGVVMLAKLDTGADTSSLHAKDIRWFSRDGADWVAFDVLGEDGRKVRFERRVERMVRIRRPGAEVQRRATILLGVCLGKVYRLTEVNLTDRSGMSHELLVGRRFLAPGFAVDSARTNTVEPVCPEARPK